MIDFHTHILPDIDDGSNSTAMSLEMLRSLKEQGVTDVLLTPHFYAYKNDVQSFLENRAHSLRELVREMKKNNLEMNLYAACETLYFDELWRIEDLKKLCIPNTNYIMLEMPFSKWNDSLLRGVENIVNEGITPIIAHFERHIFAQRGLSRIYELIDMGARLQTNCDAVTNIFFRGTVLSLIKKGVVVAIGTDCHDMKKRRPQYKKAINYVKSHLKPQDYEKFESRQNRIIKNAEMVALEK